MRKNLREAHEYTAQKKGPTGSLPSGPKTTNRLESNSLSRLVQLLGNHRSATFSTTLDTLHLFGLRHSGLRSARLERAQPTALS
jgi:hypothetical protein